MNKKPWGEKDDETLLILRKQRKTLIEIGNVLGRSYDSIRSRIRHLASSGTDVALPDEDITGNITKVDTGNGLNIDDFVDSIKNLNIKLHDQKLIVNYSKSKQDQSTILDISDCHIGMSNTVFDAKLRKERLTYSYEIFLKEMEVLREAVFRIHHLQSQAYNLKTLYINLLGDLLTNDRIYSGQNFQIDRCVGKQIWDGVAEFAALIENLKAIYQKIIVTAVVGNHGRSLPEYSEEPVENNFEYHLYKILQLLFRNDNRIQIDVPNTRQHIIEIDGHRHLLLHGDSMRGASENAIEKQVKELMLNLGHFDMMHMGHFHKLSEMEIGDKIVVKRNGSWIELDNYALTKFKQASTPKQWIIGSSIGRLETWAYKINLKE